MEIVLGKTAGFCYGVKRAVEGVKEELEKEENVYCLGEIVHNKSVIRDLEAKGVTFINDVSQSKGKTIIRAHGVTKKVYEELSKNKIEFKDFTCPNVVKIHKIAEEYRKKDYFIILVGVNNHPESIGTISFCGENSAILQDFEQIDNLLVKIENKNNILVIAQTTYNSAKFDEIIDILKEKLVNKNIEVLKTICQATKIRQDETRKIAKKVDIMLIIGDKNSSNTNKLYDISSTNCERVYFIQTVDEIKHINFDGIKKVGVMAGASTPNEDIQAVVNELRRM